MILNLFQLLPVLTCLAIAAAASVANIAIAPHNPNGPIAGAAALHFALSTPNHIIQEVMDQSVPWYNDVISTSPIVRNGDSWDIPSTAGLGIEVNLDVLSKYRINLLE